MTPLRAALAGFIDYAGLFPPASLDLQTTISHHEQYAQSGERWMLGRCVVPLPRLDDVAATLARSTVLRPAWTIAVLVSAEDPLDAVVAAIDRFHDSKATVGVTVTAIEAALPRLEAVAEFASAIPGTLERFVEVPLDGARDAWLDAIADRACSAKVRTGGVTADRFPSAASLAAVLAACAHRRLPLKATAGLHHPIRAAYRLTYDAASPSGLMHGFVNLLAAALILHSGGGAEADAKRALEVQDPRQFAFDDTALSWQRHSFGADACAGTRAHLLRSVGSCSFEEPVAELRGLGWMQ